MHYLFFYVFFISADLFLREPVLLLKESAIVLTLSIGRLFYTFIILLLIHCLGL